MEAGKKRNLRSGDQYESLFPKANVNDHTVMSNAVVADTVAFIPRVVNKTQQQTASIARKLAGANDYETCRNIWNFVYTHIGYRKDETGYEQVRSPARTWHDRRKGVDCDCYTTFISSILTNLGIRHKLRITKYSRDQFQHIYPIALLNGREVILDCVTDKFDYEVPFSEKKDFPMDLQYLDGLDGHDDSYNQLIYGTSGIGELGRLFGKKKKASSGGAAPSNSDDAPPPSGAKKKKGFKKILNAVNKVNPATLALRNGVLAAMKLNLFNVAKRMRWSYLSANQAKAKGINIDRWKKLVTVRQKLENIFYGAGGNPDNLKKAMLNGKGNKDNAVHGIDDLGFVYDRQLDNMGIRTSLPQLLGGELYYSENPMSALGELGEPVTAATVAAASGAIATIAALIKKIGDIFGGKGEGSKDFDESANNDDASSNTGPAAKSATKTSSSGGDGNSAEPNDNGDSGSPVPGNSALFRAGKSSINVSRAVARPNNFSASNANTDSSSASQPEPSSQDSGGDAQPTSAPVKSDGGTSSSAVAKNNSGDDTGSNNGDQSMWEKNKKWIIPVGMGVGLLTAAIIGYKIINAKPSANGPSKPMNGLPTHKKRPRKSKHKGKPGKKAAVILL